MALLKAAISKAHSQNNWVMSPSRQRALAFEIGGAPITPYGVVASIYLEDWIATDWEVLPLGKQPPEGYR